jgi:hypothetical protein
MSKKKLQNKNGKYIFFLKNINSDKIDSRYGITIISNINDTDTKQPTNTTNIEDLSNSINTPEIISFFDESKREHKCNISMIDFDTRINIRSLSYNCFWCRSPIPSDIIAIGCPIKYIPSQTTKKYYSEISKDTYVIKENITTHKSKLIKNFSDNRLSIIEHDYYLTDGSFCSFNCSMAYIHENKIHSKYSLSQMLLLKMYSDMYGTKGNYDNNIIIEKAPSWKLLKQYGGHITIEKFRESFNKIEYIDHGLITSIPKCKSIGTLFEQMIKF